MISSSVPTGVLFSGGLDGGILLGQLLERERTVQPIYIRSHLHWEPAELQSARRFCAALGCGEKTERLRPLVVLNQPLSEIYRGHWSLTGQGVPDSLTPDEAMYLPGRNSLLLVMSVVYCQMNSLGRLALGALGTNPFADATPAFFTNLMSALNAGASHPVELELPFQQLDKQAVMRMGSDYPLELTFSCVDPLEGRHCGRCNKCAERQHAFQYLDRPDPTDYAATAVSDQSKR